MINKKIVSLMLVILLVFLTACSGNKDDTYVDVTLNEVVHSVFYAPQYVAIENMYFEDEGINLTLETGWGADKSMAALLSDNADVILAGPESSIYVYAQGRDDFPISFAQLTQRAGNFLIGREDEKNFDWTSLKGKTIIGGRQGGMPQLVLEYILKDKGLVPYEDVEIITNIDFGATAGAFASGTGDYTVEFEPTATSVENEGIGYVVSSLGVESGNVPYTSYITTKSIMEGEGDMLVRFARAIYRGQVYCMTHTSEDIARVIHPQFEEMTIEDLTKIVDRYKVQGTFRPDPMCDIEGYKLLVDILRSGGTLEGDIDVTEVIDNTYSLKATK